MVDFRNLLNVKLDDIAPPKALPAGTYHGSISKFEVGDNNKNKTPYVRIHLNFTQAGADIPAEDLADIDLSQKKMTRDFFLTPDARYRLKELIASCGIMTEGRAFDETLPELVNQPVLIEVTQRLNTEDPAAPPRNDVKSIKGDQG
jgi:hypothetical protein